MHCSLNFMYFLWARHDHNKIAPCGMIKVFWIELNWFWIELNWNTHSITQQHTHTHTHIRARAHSHSHSRTERERVVVEVVVVVVVVRERERQTDRETDRDKDRDREKAVQATITTCPKGLSGRGSDEYRLDNWLDGMSSGSSNWIVTSCQPGGVTPGRSRRWRRR